MNVTVRIPDDFAKRLGSGDLGRRALEALALEEYRAERLTASDLGHLLGFSTQTELASFLTARGATPPAYPEQNLVSRFRAFRVGKTLDGLDPIALIREGRR
jgi:hypothetical protein